LIVGTVDDDSGPPLIPLEGTARASSGPARRA